MGVLADLLAPYQAAVAGTPTTPEMFGGAGGGLFDLASQLPQGSGGPGGGGNYDASAGHWEDVAAQMAQKRYGWGPHQFNAVDQIASAESGWNPGAVNPSSGAAGIPQALPSAHPGLVDSQWMHDPRAQIAWMLNYIHGRYGTPQHALDVRQQQGWY